MQGMSCRVRRSQRMLVCRAEQPCARTVLTSSASTCPLSCESSHGKGPREHSSCAHRTRLAGRTDLGWQCAFGPLGASFSLFACWPVCSASAGVPLVGCICMARVPSHGAHAGITGFDPVNAVSSGGISITISGLDFGTTSYTPTADLGQFTACATTSWTSSTTVGCYPDFDNWGTGGGIKPYFRGSSTYTSTTDYFTFDGVLHWFSVYFSCLVR